MTHSTLKSLLLLLLSLCLLAPATLLAAPGDSAPGADDEAGDDEEEDDKGPGDSGPSDEDEADEDEGPGDSAPSVDDEEEAPADEDEDEPLDPEDDPLLAPDTEPGDSAPEPEPEEESEEDLDDRYSVEDPAEEEKPARARRSKADAREDDDGRKAEIEEEAVKRKGLVKVIQRKFFLKYRRVEITPMVGYMGTDDFINRLAVGAMFNAHVNDIFSLEFLFNYLPDLGEVDYKGLTQRLRNRDEVVPDISRIVFLGTANIAIAPIYGKIELGTLSIINYDIYITAGAGVASTVDDTFIIQSACDGNSRAQNKAIPECSYVNQEHFTANLGGGFRIVFNDFIGIRLDGRFFTHIEETYRDGEVGLDMKQNFMVSFGVSLFVPPTRRNVN